MVSISNEDARALSDVLALFQSQGLSLRDANRIRKARKAIKNIQRKIR